MLIARSVWWAFWGELNASNSFYADPKGASENQAGHWAIGVFLSVVLALLYAVLCGELPSRWGVWLSVTLGYFVLVEAFNQGWKGADTVIDTLFVSLGAAVPLVPLKEAAFYPEIILKLRGEEGLALLAATLVIYAAYIIPRLYRWGLARTGA